jgi:hypothetical protein
MSTMSPILPQEARVCVPEDAYPVEMEAPPPQFPTANNYAASDESSANVNNNAASDESSANANNNTASEESAANANNNAAMDTNNIDDPPK